GLGPWFGLGREADESPVPLDSDGFAPVGLRYPSLAARYTTEQDQSTDSTVTGSKMPGEGTGTHYPVYESTLSEMDRSHLAEFYKRLRGVEDPKEVLRLLRDREHTARPKAPLVIAGTPAGVSVSEVGAKEISQPEVESDETERKNRFLKLAYNAGVLVGKRVTQMTRRRVDAVRDSEPESEYVGRHTREH